MKKKLVSLLLSLCLLFTLVPTAFADDAVASAENTKIDVKVEKLPSGYYLGAVWHGDELLCLFDDTVGSDGILQTTVDVGKVIPDGEKVTVGISSENAGGKTIDPIVYTIGNPSKPPSGDDPSTPPSAGHVYKISISNGKGGTVSAPAQGTAGDSISVTVTPDRGYALESIVAKDAAGNTIRLTWTNGQYKFTMPNSNVTIYASFGSTDQNTAPAVNTATPKPVVSTPGSSAQSSLSVGVFSSGTASIGGLKYSVEFILSANAAGGTGGYSYQFEVTQNGKLTKTTGWTDTNVFSGNLSGSGTCVVEITVKDSSGNTASTTVDLLKTNGILRT